MLGRHLGSEQAADKAREEIARVSRRQRDALARADAPPAPQRVAPALAPADPLTGERIFALLYALLMERRDARAALSSALAANQERPDVIPFSPPTETERVKRQG